MLEELPYRVPRMLKRALIALTVSGAALALSVGPAAAGPPEEATFATRCAKGGGTTSIRHGHDYMYLYCSGGTHDGERHWL